MPGFLKRHQRKVIWLVVIAFFIGGVGLFSLNQSGLFGGRSTADGGVSYAATVNGVTISKEAASNVYQNLVNQYYSYYQQIGQDPSKLFSGANGALATLQFQAEALESLIQQTLYDQAAKERRIRVDRSEVDAAYAAEYNYILAVNGIDEETLASYLASQGRALHDYQESLRSYVETQLENEALREAIVGAIEPTDDELLGYFEANISSYDVPEEVLGADYDGRMGHDGWSPYDAFERALHQQCLAHLLRRAAGLLERATAGARWSTRCSLKRPIWRSRRASALASSIALIAIPPA